MEIFESTSEKNLHGKKCNYFSLKGNSNSGNVVRTGWVKSRLGEEKKKKIEKMLNDSHVDKVYRRGNKLFALMLNGVEVEI